MLQRNTSGSSVILMTTDPVTQVEAAPRDDGKDVVDYPELLFGFTEILAKDAPDDVAAPVPFDETAAQQAAEAASDAADAAPTPAPAAATPPVVSPTRAASAAPASAIADSSSAASPAPTN